MTVPRFDFAGLGVKDGDPVDIREGLLGEGILKDGKVVPAPRNEPQPRQAPRVADGGSKRTRLIGLFLVTSALVCFALLFRKKNT